MRSNLSVQKQQQHLREMDAESLAKFVFRHLKKQLKHGPGRPEFYSSVNGLVEVLLPKPMTNDLSASDHAMIAEAVVLLERRGLVVRDVWDPLRHVSSDKFIVYLTSVGLNSKIDDEAILLVDKPEETVDKLEESVESLDDIVRQYYLESLRAYQEGLYISSVICLGAASERAIHWLAGAIQSHSEKYQEGIKKRRHISGLTKYLVDSVIPIIFAADKEFARELKDLLDELGKLYRKNRNDAGHPETVDQTNWLGEDQEILLLHFRRYITTICEAVERLKKQSAF